MKSNRNNDGLNESGWRRDRTADTRIFSRAIGNDALLIVTRGEMIDCGAGGCQPNNNAQQKAQHIQGDTTPDEEWEALRQLWPKIGIEGRRQLVRSADDSILLQMEDL